jgi:hypothetical protein
MSAQAFASASGADDQFRYFNYLFDYPEPTLGEPTAERQGLTIASLPLVTELEGRRAPAHSLPGAPGLVAQ